MGELETKQEFVAPTPEYPKTAEQRRLVYQQIVRLQQNSSHDNLLRKRMRLAVRVAIARDNNDAEQQELLKITMDVQILTYPCPTKRKRNGDLIKR